MGQNACSSSIDNAVTGRGQFCSDSAHEAIIDETIFNAVRECIADNHHRHRSRKSKIARSPLTGKIHDADGLAMRTTFSYGRGRRMYRYYVSECLTPNGKIATGDNRRGLRVSARHVEMTIAQALGAWSDAAAFPWSLLHKVTVIDGRLVLEISTQMFVLAGLPENIALSRARTCDAQACVDNGIITLVA